MLFRHRCTLSLSLLLIDLLAHSAMADLAAYEPFPIPSSQLVGMNFGTGFSGPWLPGGFNASVSTNYSVWPDGLTFGALQTTGGRAFGDFTSDISGLTRSLNDPLGATGTTRYISFLIRREQAPLQNNFFGLTLESPGEPEIFTGRPGSGATGDWIIEDRGGTNQHDSLIPAVVGVTSLMVIKADFGPTVDTFTLYVNPIPGGPEPLIGTVKQDVNVGTIGGLTLYSTGAYSIDEIRVGSTFADVTPVVPEPASGLLLALAASLLARRRCPRH